MSLVTDISLSFLVISGESLIRWSIQADTASLENLTHAIYRLNEMSVDSEFTDLVLILLKRQNDCKLILQTTCLVFSSVHFKMFVKCL